MLESGLWNQWNFDKASIHPESEISLKVLKFLPCLTNTGDRGRQRKTSSPDCPSSGISASEILGLRWRRSRSKWREGASNAIDCQSVSEYRQLFLLKLHSKILLLFPGPTGPEFSLQQQWNGPSWGIGSSSLLCYQYHLLSIFLYLSIFVMQVCQTQVTVVGNQHHGEHQDALVEKPDDQRQSAAHHAREVFQSMTSVGTARVSQSKPTQSDGTPVQGSNRAWSPDGHPTFSTAGLLAAVCGISEPNKMCDMLAPEFRSMHWL